MKKLIVSMVLLGLGLSVSGFFLLRSPAAAGRDTWTRESAEASVQGVLSDFHVFERGSMLVVTARQHHEAKRTFDRLVIPMKAYIAGHLGISIIPQPLVVYYLPGDAYKAVVRHHEHAGQSESAGFYNKERHALYVNAEIGPGNVMHELTHAIVMQDFRSRHVPIWFNEGLATFFENGHFDYKSFVPNPDNRIAVFRGGESLRLASLLSADAEQGTPDDFAGDKSSVYYATAKMFCLYAEERNVLARLYANMKAGSDSVTAVEAAFSEDLSVVDAGFQEWLNRQVKAKAAHKDADDSK